MLYPVPFARACRVVADRDRDADRIAEILQVHLPGSPPAAVAAARIRIDQQATGPAVPRPAVHAPLSPNAFHGEFCRVVRGPHLDHSPVLDNDVHFVRLALRPPRPPLVLKSSHQFFLLGVDRDHRIVTGAEHRFLPVDVPELGILVGVLRSFLRLAVSSRHRATVLPLTGCPRRVNSFAIDCLDWLVHRRALIGSPAVVCSAIRFNSPSVARRSPPLSSALPRRPVSFRPTRSLPSWEQSITLTPYLSILVFSASATPSPAKPSSRQPHPHAPAARSPAVHMLP